MSTVTVIGAGTIGLGWINLFSASGLTVRVNSRRPDVRRIVREGLELFSPGRADELAERIEYEPDIARAVAGADLVSENAPDDLPLKQRLFAEIGEAAPARALVLSSTSKLLPDDLSRDMAGPGRLVVAHPFNPPHIVPLVEVIGGERTDPEAVERAVAFLESVGRTPVVLRRALPGFAANRLQSALLRESIHLVLEGVVTVEELDRIVTESIGLRWSTIGPFHAFHLGGGPGGLRKWLEHLGSGLEQGWRGLGQPALTPQAVETVVEQTEAAYGHRTYAELVRDRDDRHHAVLAALGRADQSQEEKK
ncbi:hydroxylacyl-CoA dehydrogenase [Streptomyces sp. MMG1533]|uniref:3-hydroxyacyl-CoA dehydrogenase NAD-binding domain-containing protein n=1 Tax=Streptomyces sp. MMG1533 TaxID=1415546 RepID=UPI0006AF1D93|nr:3-hydroxyacyl-CoA dehydrogenase NAD-binding domain-containing protein [Streptomyces sp. MMG1533]KOU63452.1 hydroxylacyl-CoA dehydrogenase [Streptomyces sp. MMG1533]